jgi:dTDP-4-amino-4,6-dideoxygalactose transaminase
MQEMLDAGIATRRGIMCSHRERVYSDAPLKHPLTFSEAAQDHSIVLPLYVQMQRSDIEHVAKRLAEAVSS